MLNPDHKSPDCEEARAQGISMGDGLSQWESETEQGEKILKFCSLGPKTYAYQLMKSDGSISEIIKCKGIPLNLSNSSVITYDSMEAIVVREAEVAMSIADPLMTLQYLQGQLTIANAIEPIHGTKLNVPKDHVKYSEITKMSKLINAQVLSDEVHLADLTLLKDEFDICTTATTTTGLLKSFLNVLHVREVDVTPQGLGVIIPGSIKTHHFTFAKIAGIAGGFKTAGLDRTVQSTVGNKRESLNNGSFGSVPHGYKRQRLNDGSYSI